MTFSSIKKDKNNTFDLYISYNMAAYTYLKYYQKHIQDICLKKDYNLKTCKKAFNSFQKNAI